ncbi:unnamed protein product, partial [Ectocarpus sp. 8 AP-2014]
ALDPKLQKRAEQAPASYELNNDEAASPAGNEPADADASSSARRAAAAASGDNKDAEREEEVVEGYSEAERGSAGTAGGRPIAEGRVAKEETREGGAGDNTEPPLSPPGSGEQGERVASRAAAAAAAAAAVAREEEGRGEPSEHTARRRKEAGDDALEGPPLAAGRVSEGVTSAGGDGRGSAAAVAGDDHAATVAAGGGDGGAGGDADVRTSGPVDSQQSVGAAAQSDGQAKGQTNTAPPPAAIPSKPARTLADVAAFVEADSIAAEKAYADALTPTATAAQSQEPS